MRIPRSRGAVSGLLLIVLGAWGGLVPFVGPYFGLAIGTNDTWDWSTDRLWMSVLPGVVAVVGGLILVQSAHRGGASLGAWLGVAAGAWFVVGPTVSRLWTADGGSAMGTPLGDNNRQVLEQLVMWEGLGVLIVAVAAFAMGRLAVRSVRDAELNEPAIVTRPVATEERFRREPAVAPAARRPWASDDDEAPTTRQPVANDAPRTREPVAAAAAPAAAARPASDEARTTRQPVAADEAQTTRQPVAATSAPAADEARTTRQPVAHTPAEVRATPRTPGEDTVATRPSAPVDPSPATSTWNPPAPAPEPSTKRSGGLMGRLRGR
jgi:hypothetical protein